VLSSRTTWKPRGSTAESPADGNTATGTIFLPSLAENMPPAR
jgi:hypothetical protein